MRLRLSRDDAPPGVGVGGTDKSVPYGRKCWWVLVGEAFKPPGSPTGELAKILIFD